MTELPLRINSFLKITGKFLAMIRSVFVFGSYERQSKPTKEMFIPLRPMLNGEQSCCCCS